MEEDEVEEHHFVEAQTVQKDAREENVVVQEEQLFIEMYLSATSHRGANNGRNTTKVDQNGVA